jgi:small subunit ribosomal protein S5
MAEPQKQQGQGGPQGGNRGRRGPRQDAPVEEKQFDERTLHIDRVARVVKGGRRFRFRALVVVGDKKGKVGIVATYKGTIPHETQAKVGGAVILIKPASAGTGLIAGGVVRTVLEVAGISNVLSKSLGSTNKVNSAAATIKALSLLESSDKWVTRKPAAAKPAAKKAAPAKKVEA